MKQSSVFTAQRIASKGRKYVKTYATSKTTKGKKFVPRRPLSAKAKAASKIKKPSPSDDPSLSSIGSLLDRCPGAVKSLALNSPGKLVYTYDC